MLSIKPLPDGYVIDDSSALPKLQFNVNFMDCGIDIETADLNSGHISLESKFSNL